MELLKKELTKVGKFVALFALVLIKLPFHLFYKAVQLFYFNLEDVA